MSEIVKTFRHAHLACGIGSGARGFNLANPRIGNVRARFECAGGIDVDPGAIANFEKLTGVKGTVMDLFTTEQYFDFHGRMPPADWHEATPADISNVFGPNVNVMFTSMPCKGFSGLLSQKQSETKRYQALNGLTLHAIWLQLEAYKDDPIDIILFENVPRIANRGRWLLDQIIALLRSYGYAVAETVHDCGELGGLAQSRNRFLLIARHMEKVPPFVYQPHKRRLRGVGEVLGKLPLPGDLIGGPMHRVPALQWQTWVRLAFVPAGKDWRALNELEVVDGHLRDFGIVPEIPLRENALGVCGWDDTAFGENIGTVQGETLPSNGKFSVADPRINTTREGSGRLGVQCWDETSGTVAGRSRPENGAYSVADPRIDGHPHHGTHGVKGWRDPAGVVGAASRPANGPHAVADPRVDGHPKSVQLGVRSWNAPAPCVKGDMSVGTGPYAINDPRLRGRTPHNNGFRIVRYEGSGADRHGRRRGEAMRRRSTNASPELREAQVQGHGVRPADAGCNRRVDHRGRSIRCCGPAREARQGRATRALPDLRPLRCCPLDGAERRCRGEDGHDNGRGNVADPRDVELDVEHVPLPAAKDRLVCRIVSLDETWHRPFTTLELAALQSIVDPDEAFYQDQDGAWCARGEFDLASRSDATKREWIGNAVPSDASRGMAETIGETLLLADMGESFFLSTKEIWVKPLALALAVDTDQLAVRIDGGRA